MSDERFTYPDAVENEDYVSVYGLARLAGVSPGVVGHWLKGGKLKNVTYILRSAGSKVIVIKKSEAIEFAEAFSARIADTSKFEDK